MKLIIPISAAMFLSGCNGVAINPPAAPNSAAQVGTTSSSSSSSSSGSVKIDYKAAHLTIPLHGRYFGQDNILLCRRRRLYLFKSRKRLCIKTQPTQLLMDRLHKANADVPPINFGNAQIKVSGLVWSVPCGKY